VSPKDNSDWRTIQLFLDKNGVSEVELDVDDSAALRCSCKDFKRSCKHVKYVKQVIESKGGNYSITVGADIEDEEAIGAIADQEVWREFVIRHGKVIALD